MTVENVPDRPDRRSWLRIVWVAAAVLLLSPAASCTQQVPAESPDVYAPDESPGGPTANDAVEETLTHTGGALAGSALTTIAGFGILVISTTIPFRQFGFVIAYTILLALLAAVLVPPSMLVLWDRWHRKRGEDPVDPAVVEAALQEAV